MNQAYAHLAVFFRGMREFRRAYPSYIHDQGLASTYDRGREIAHCLTLRCFER